MNAAMRSVLALAPFLLVHPTTISAAAQDRAKVNVVLNFAADGGRRRNSTTLSSADIFGKQVST